MEKLKKELNNIIDKIRSLPLENSEELEYLKTNFRSIKVENWKNSDFILALTRIRNVNVSFNEIKEDIDTLKNDFNESSLSALVDILEFVVVSDIDSDSNERQIYDIYWKYLEYGEKNGIWKGFSTLTEPFLRTKEKFAKFVNFFFKYNLMELPAILDELDNYKTLCEQGLINEVLTIARTGRVADVTSVKSLKKVKRDMDAALELKRLSEEGVLVDLVDDVKKIDELVGLLNFHISKLEKQQKLEMKENNKKIHQYEVLIGNLFSINHIRKEDISFIEDDELKEKIVSKILEKNKKEYLILKEEYKQNKKYEVNEFDKLLLDYNIKISDQYYKTVLIKNLSIDDIKSKIKKICSSDFDFIINDEIKLTKILLFSDINILEKISFLLKQDIITLDFLKNNVDILIGAQEELKDELKSIYDKSLIEPKFDILNSNIELFKDSNICLQNIKKYDINLFLGKTDEIEEILNLVNIYDINLDSTDLTNFSFLSDPKQLNMIDLFIEVGMFDYLNDNISLINKDVSFVKKIILLKQIGYKDFDKNNIIQSVALNPNRFYISDDKLDLYISNAVMDYLNLDCYIALEEGKNIEIDEELKDTFVISVLDYLYKLDSNTYKINDVLISRNKVLRNITTLNKCDFDSEVTEKEKLYTAIFYNSILPEKQIISVIEDIDNKMELTDKKIKLKKN